MASPYYSLRPKNNKRSKVFDLEAFEPRPTVTESKRIALKSSPETIIKAERWLQLTMVTSSSNVHIGTKSGAVAQKAAFPMPTDVIVTIMLAPNSQLYASGSDGSDLNVIIQPLPIKHG
jgi:hypothetical protein